MNHCGEALHYSCVLPTSFSSGSTLCSTGRKAVRVFAEVSVFFSAAEDAISDRDQTALLVDRPPAHSGIRRRSAVEAAARRVFGSDHDTAAIARLGLIDCDRSGFSFTFQCIVATIASCAATVIPVSFKPSGPTLARPELRAADVMPLALRRPSSRYNFA
jgi:hypothetical protein